MINKNQCKAICPLIARLLVQFKMWLTISLIRDIFTFFGLFNDEGYIFIRKIQYYIKMAYSDSIIVAPICYIFFFLLFLSFPTSLIFTFLPSSLPFFLIASLSFFHLRVLTLERLNYVRILILQTPNYNDKMWLPVLCQFRLAHCTSKKIFYFLSFFLFLPLKRFRFDLVYLIK